MPEEFDFAELRKYLRGQIDMGDSEVFLDEPWTLVKRAAPAPSRPAINTAPSVPASAQFSPVTNNPAANVSFAATSAPSASVSLAGESPAASLFAPTGGLAAPAARPVVKKTASAFESAESLDAFYAAIKSDVVYANIGDLALYEGPANPKVLLLLPAPPAQGGPFFATPAGEMLVRLFGSLSIPAESIGVTFFYKGRTARNIPALLEATLKKMLAKELSFIAPSVMVTFGEPLFHQVFGKGKNFEEHAGTDMEFSGVKTCSLVDAYAMSQDKQLKWVTWKVHIPKSSYFKA
jgi:uracil-DNA glycosylase